MATKRIRPSGVKLVYRLAGRGNRPVTIEHADGATTQVHRGRSSALNVRGNDGRVRETNVVATGDSGWRAVDPHGVTAVHRSQHAALVAARQRAQSPGLAEPIAEDEAQKRILAAVSLRITKSGGALRLERANGSADAAAERMLASLPGANVHDQYVGPFYDTKGLGKWFGMTRQGLAKKAEAGDIICLTTSDKRRVYPSFQFDAHGTPLPRLREVMAVLDPEQKALWGDAIWLNAPEEDLDGMTPAEALRTDRADNVIEFAAQAGAFRLP